MRWQPDARPSPAGQILVLRGRPTRRTARRPQSAGDAGEAHAQLATIGRRKRDAVADLRRPDVLDASEPDRRGFQQAVQPVDRRSGVLAWTPAGRRGCRHSGLAQARRSRRDASSRFRRSGAAGTGARRHRSCNANACHGNAQHGESTNSTSVRPEPPLSCGPLILNAQRELLLCRHGHYAQGGMHDGESPFGGGRCARPENRLAELRAGAALLELGRSIPRRRTCSPRCCRASTWPRCAATATLRSGAPTVACLKWTATTGSASSASASCAPPG